MSVEALACTAVVTEADCPPPLSTLVLRPAGNQRRRENHHIQDADGRHPGLQRRGLPKRIQVSAQSPSSGAEQLIIISHPRWLLWACRKESCCTVFSSTCTLYLYAHTDTGVCTFLRLPAVSSRPLSSLLAEIFSDSYCYSRLYLIPFHICCLLCCLVSASWNQSERNLCTDRGGK